MKWKWIAALVMGITMLTGSAFASNDPNNPKRQCLQDARDEKKACNQVCKDDFLTAVDACRGADHACADQARDAHQACVTGVLDSLKQCLEDQCSDFGQLIADCRSSFPAGTSTRDKCVDGAQLGRFQCRDTCREQVQLFKSLKACRDEFKADLKACVPTPTPQPMGP